MTVDVFTMKCDALEGAKLVGFRGKEAISQPFEFLLFFTMPAGTEVSGAVGQAASLVADRGPDHEVLAWHGVIAGVSLLHQTLERAVYQARLVPRLWALRHFWRSYVFTDMKLPEFLSSALEDGGLASDDYQFFIDQNLYATEEFVAQYRETHLDFFHRWLEREGLYYYFEHDPEGASEKLVIVDNRGHHDPLLGEGKVFYKPTFDDGGGYAEAFHHLAVDVQWLPKSVTIADYDYGHPSANLSGDHEVTGPGLGTIREYGFRAFDASNIKRLSQVRAESIGCREATMRASGDYLGIRSGYLFSVEDRPDIVDEKWLAVEVEHAGTVSATTPEMAQITGLTLGKTYQVKVFAVRETEQYRHPQKTPWPRIYGFENGVVCGDATSKYAQIDDDGRYMVRFEFDTSDLPDGKASTRVRMLQPHGGDTEGFHFPLRKGTEVMIGFLGGDPDRPFIAGVVPNTHKPSVVGSRNHTQNVIRTGSGNQIVMEDDEGKEFIYMSSPNNSSGIYIGHPTGKQSGVYTGEGEAPLGDFRSPANANPVDNGVTVVSGFEASMLQQTEGNFGLWVGTDYQEDVAGYKNVFVEQDAWFGYLGSHWLHVGAASEEIYFDLRETTITLNWDVEVGTSYTIHVQQGKATENFDSGHEQNVQSGQKITVAGGQELTVSDGGQTIDVTGDKTEHIHGACKITVDADAKWTWLGTKWEWTTGVKTGIHGGMKNSILLGGKADVVMGVKQLVVVGSKSDFVVGAKVDIVAGTTFKTKGPEVEVKAAWIKTLGGWVNSTPAKIQTAASAVHTEAMKVAAHPTVQSVIATMNIFV